MLWPIDKARLRARREALGWTVQELATRAGQSVRTIENLESPRGRTSARPVTHHCLTKALGDPDGSLRLRPRLSRLPEVPPAPPTRRRAVPGASVPDTPTRRANVSITFTPQLTPLEMLAERERRAGVDDLHVDDLPLVTACLIWNVQTLFGVHAKTRVLVRGIVVHQQILTPAEASALGASVGSAARFVIAREVVPGAPLFVTVHAPDGAFARALQRAMSTRAPVDVEAMVSTSPDMTELFDHWREDELQAWTLVVIGSAKPAQGDVALTWEPPGGSPKKPPRSPRRKRS